MITNELLVPFKRKSKSDMGRIQAHLIQQELGQMLQRCERDVHYACGSDPRPNYRQNREERSPAGVV